MGPCFRQLVDCRKLHSGDRARIPPNALKAFTQLLLAVDTAAGWQPTSAARHWMYRSDCRAGSPSMYAGIGAKYTVRLQKPLGITFEECTPGQDDGVAIANISETGSAYGDSRVCVGDKLLRVSAVVFGGQGALLTIGNNPAFTDWQRELIPCAKESFDTIMAAIGSNNGRWGYTDIVLELQHTEASVPRSAVDVQRVAEQKSDWDPVRGYSVGGKSLPIAPGKDNFDID